MKIFSDIQVSPENKPVFILYLDTQVTGDQNKDCLYAAHDFTPYVGNNDPEKLLELITPMLSELLYAAYGESPENARKEPITDWHATGFDRNYPNGVKA
jgi:hypothetical protein